MNCVCVFFLSLLIHDLPRVLHGVYLGDEFKPPSSLRAVEQFCATSLRYLGSPTVRVQKGTSCLCACTCASAPHRSPALTASKKVQDSGGPPRRSRRRSVRPRTTGRRTNGRHRTRDATTRFTRGHSTKQRSCRAYAMVLHWCSWRAQLSSPCVRGSQHVGRGTALVRGTRDNRLGR